MCVLFLLGPRSPMADTTLYLYDSETIELFGEAYAREEGVDFPEGVDGWPDVMDCRTEPYTDKSVEENCDLAHHVRKPYILVTERQHDQHTPDDAGDPDAD